MSGIPIDRGWAWVCLLGAAVNVFFVVGGLRCVGLLFIVMVEKFNASRTITSMTVGFIAAGFAILSPVANALGMRFTIRKVTVIGGVCTALSALLTAFAPNIYYIVVVFGVITGVGYGLMFGPSMVIVGVHFKERRSLANGLAAAGGSLGQLIIPQLLTVLLAEYSFQGCMLIYSAIILHTIPACMLFRPLSAYRKTPKAAIIPDNKNPLPDSNANNKQLDIQTNSVEHLPSVNGNGSGGLNVNMSKTAESEPMLNVKPINKNLSKSKQSMYESTSSLYFGPHQEVPPEMLETKEKSGVKGKLAGDNKRTGCLGICCGIFEWSLFKNWLFVIYVGGVCCGHAGYINLCMFFPPYAAELGTENKKVALLLSIIGVSDLIGRVFGGWFADLGLVKRNNIMAVCLSFTGVCAVLVPFLPQFATLVVFCIVLGMIGGVYVSLMVVVIIDFLGLEKLSSSFGLATMCMGLATVPVSPALGIIKDTLGSFSPGFRICGALMIIGGLFFGTEPIARKLEASKSKADLGVTQANTDDPELPKLTSDPDRETVI